MRLNSIYISGRDLLYDIYRNNPSMKIREVKPQDKDMVDGIVDIINQVKDKDNRHEIAAKMVKQLKSEKIVLNYADFLKSCK